MEDNISQLPEAWQLAIRREIESNRFYARMAQSSGDSSLRALFESLAAEEARHRQRLEAEYKQLFEADLQEAKGRTGVFEHELKARTPPLISWHEWEEETFRLAQNLDVPILLSIGAVWCHWCHVMDRATFSDREVAAYIDAHFVPIRVDNDKRPDINARYNMGGWPTVAFLTPKGDILTGGTYMPPAQFKSVMQQVSEYYQQNKETLEQRSQQPRRERGERQTARAQRVKETTPAGAGRTPEAASQVAAGELDRSIEETVFWSAAAQFDPDLGGFGEAPKFPQTEAIELAMERYARTGEPKALEIVTVTLRAMAQGGIYDREMGGFFRYSTTQDWSVPHFEKMLEDNAKLLTAFLHAYQITGEAFFRETAQGIVSYVEGTLHDRQLGYFFGSQDADEDYYALSRNEREKRPAPYVDTVAYTAWNAMMASAYLEAAVNLEQPELAMSALTTLNFLWKECWLPGQGMCHYWDGEAHLPGLLVDQAWMAYGLLHAYEYTAEEDYLLRAQEILQWVHSHLATQAGSFLDRPQDPAALGRLAETHTSIAENAIAAEALLRLSRLSGQDVYTDWARQALGAFARDCGRYGLFAAGYALAVQHLLHEPLRLVVVGSAEEAKTRELLRSAWRAYAPNRTLLAVDPLWESERLQALGYPPEPAPAAYVCQGQVCTEPVREAAQVMSTLQDTYPWKKHK